MSVGMRLCVGTVVLPLEETEVEVETGDDAIIKGHLVGLTMRGNYKWLEQAHMQKHRF